MTSDLVKPELVLRILGERDRADMLRVWAANAKRMQRWTTMPSDIGTKVDRRIADAQKGYRDGTLFHYGYHLGRAGPYFGDISIDAINNGSGELGFWLDERYESRAHTSQAVDLMISLAFDTLGLTSLLADVQPYNQPSRFLIRKLGFRETGDRSEIIINGEPVSHIQFALSRSRWQEMTYPSVSGNTPCSTADLPLVPVELTAGEGASNNLLLLGVTF